MDSQNVIGKIKGDPKEALKRVLAECEITFREVTSVNVTYKEPQNRLFVKCLVEECNGKTFTLLVDLKLGNPTTDQVFDAVYREGKVFDKRIILFTGEDSEEVIWDNCVVEGFVYGMNTYGAQLSLCQVTAPDGDLRFERTDETPEEFYSNRIPSELQVRDCEFWNVYFARYYTGDKTYPYEHMACELDLRRAVGVMGTVEEKVELHGYWDHWGMRIEIVPTDKTNYVELMAESGMKVLLQTFPTAAVRRGLFTLRAGTGCEVIDYDAYYPGMHRSRIIIELNNIGIDYLLKADPEWKTNFAEEINDKLQKVREIFENFIRTHDGNVGKCEEKTVAVILE